MTRRLFRRPTLSREYLNSIYLDIECFCSFCIPVTTSTFPDGRMFVYTRSIPTDRAISFAVFSLSPVSITSWMPRDFKAVIAALAPGLGVSRPIIPMTLLLTDTSIAVFRLVGSKKKGLYFGLE